MGKGMNRYEDRGQDRPSPTVDYKAIIEQGDVDKMVVAAREIARSMREGTETTTQLRKVFSTIRIIQTQWPDAEAQKRSDEDKKRAEHAYRQTVLMKPRLAYSRAKLGTLEPILQNCLTCISGSNSEKRERFFNLVDFLESIVAYHK